MTTTKHEEVIGLQLIGEFFDQLDVVIDNIVHSEYVQITQCRNWFIVVRSAKEALFYIYNGGVIKVRVGYVEEGLKYTLYVLIDCRFQTYVFILDVGDGNATCNAVEYWTVRSEASWPLNHISNVQRPVLGDIGVRCVGRVVYIPCGRKVSRLILIFTQNCM